MQETRVRSLGQQDPLGKEMVTLSSILACEIPWNLEVYSLWGCKESDTTALDNQVEESVVGS